jgi:histidyl-tRNA synthetase
MLSRCNEDLRNLIEAAPKLIDHLDEASAKHFEEFKAYLDCLNITYMINTRLVRS